MLGAQCRGGPRMSMATQRGRRPLTWGHQIRGCAWWTAGGGPPRCSNAQASSPVGRSRTWNTTGRSSEDRVREILSLFTQRSDSSKLSNFWESHQTRDMRKPMMSLRDVDAGGVILAATRDPWRGKNVHLETTRQVMRVHLTYATKNLCNKKALKNQGRAVVSDVLLS
jgi:hypothetical protein